MLRTSDLDEATGEVDVSFEIPYIYFGIFDGHAGSGCAVTAANELHQVRVNKFGLSSLLSSGSSIKSSQLDEPPSGASLPRVV